MIRLEESQVAQILPECLSERAGVQALSFALGAAMQRLMGYCRGIGVYSAIDVLGDDVLDMLAIELDTQYYEDSFDIWTKRRLIKGALLWYGKAGTPAAVEELVAATFGQGEVKEWFEYGGKPYMFRVITDAGASYASIEEFENLIKRIKNVRSHIDKISFLRNQETRIYVAVASIVKETVKVGWEETDGSIQ